MSDYEVTVRARNNRILSRVRKLGFETSAAFCRAYNLNSHEFSALLTMREPAARPSGEWRAIVWDVSSALGCEPEEMFTDRQAQGRVKAVTRIVDEEQLLALTDLEGDASMLPSPEDEAAKSELVRTVKAELSKMTPRVQQMMSDHFGLGDAPPRTFAEIAQTHHVSMERVRQIVAKAIRMLKRNKHENLLLPHLEERGLA